MGRCACDEVVRLAETEGRAAKRSQEPERPSRARFACREAIRLPEGEARVAKRPQGAEREPRDAEEVPVCDS